MPKKRSAKKPAAKSKPKPTAPPFYTKMLKNLLGFFREDFPVTDYHGHGRFETEVADTKLHQPELEEICGGRLPKSQKHVLRALVRPEAESGVFKVDIQGHEVGKLKPADGKLLRRQLDKAGIEDPCAVRADALVEGGRRKKNGEEDPFTVRLCLPPRPKPKAAAEPAANDEFTNGE